MNITRKIMEHLLYFFFWLNVLIAIFTYFMVCRHGLQAWFVGMSRVKFTKIKKSFVVKIINEFKMVKEIKQMISLYQCGTKKTKYYDSMKNKSRISKTCFCPACCILMMSPLHLFSKIKGILEISGSDSSRVNPSPVLSWSSTFNPS